MRGTGDVRGKGKGQRIKDCCSRPGPHAFVALVALLVPSFALAAGTDPLNFGSGPVADMAHVVLGYAKGWVVFSFILGLVLELFGRAPGQPRNYAGVVWRLVIVVFLLAQYDFVFGTVKRGLDSAAAQLAPGQGDFFKGVEALSHGLGSQDPASPQNAAPPAQAAGLAAQLGSAKSQYDAALAAGDSAAALQARAWVDRVTGALKAMDPRTWGNLGGFLFDTLATFVFLFAELAHLLVSRLGQLLAATLYILGPLALVFSIPTFSGVGHAWFRRYVTYCTWPLFSGILLKLVLALLVSAKAPAATSGQVAQSFFVAAMMILTALSVPALASELVGGSASHFASMGAAKAMAAARSTTDAVHAAQERAKAWRDALMGGQKGGQNDKKKGGQRGRH